MNTEQRKIHVGEVYTVKDVEGDNQAFIGAEIKVYWTATSFAQMTLGMVSEDDYGCTIFRPVGASARREATVESDMRVEVIALNDKGMPTVGGSAVNFYDEDEEVLFFAAEVPRSPGDAVFMTPGFPRMLSWSEIKENAAGRPIYVSEPSWEKIGE